MTDSGFVIFKDKNEGGLISAGFQIKKDAHLVTTQFYLKTTAIHQPSKPYTALPLQPQRT